MYNPLMARAALFFMGLWWCKVVIGRLPSDIRELNPDSSGSSF